MVKIFNKDMQKSSRYLDMITLQTFLKIENTLILFAMFKLSYTSYKLFSKKIYFSIEYDQIQNIRLNVFVLNYPKCMTGECILHCIQFGYDDDHHHHHLALFHMN